MTSPDIRYPVGRYRPPGPWSDADRSAAIDEIARLPQALAAAVSGLTDAQLDTPYRPGGWTVRQVVHHVADSHINAYTRAKLALTEDTPTIKPYDQDAWSAFQDARTLPVEVSLALLTALHERFVTLFRSLSPADFARPFSHPESGPQTVDTLVAIYAWHGRHHTAHITNLRESSGW